MKREMIYMRSYGFKEAGENCQRPETSTPNLKMEGSVPNTDITSNSKLTMSIDKPESQQKNMSEKLTSFFQGGAGGGCFKPEMIAKNAEMQNIKAYIHHFNLQKQSLLEKITDFKRVMTKIKRPFFYLIWILLIMIALPGKSWAYFPTYIGPCEDVDIQVNGSFEFQFKEQSRMVSIYGFNTTATIRDRVGNIWFEHTFTSYDYQTILVPHDEAAFIFTITSSNSNPIYLKSPAKPSIPVIFGITKYILGQTIELTAPDNIGAISYSWTGPNGFTASGPSITIPQASIYNQGLYEFKAQGSCGNSSASTYVTVSSFTVTHTRDDLTEGSLRWVITQVNAQPEGTSHTIDFNIPGTGPHIITLSSLLPSIVRSATIDGTSQPGYSANANPPVIVQGASDVYKIFSLNASNCIVRGLYIKNMSEWDPNKTNNIGIVVKGNNCIIANNVINSVTNGINIGDNNTVNIITNTIIKNNIIGTDKNNIPNVDVVYGINDSHGSNTTIGGAEEGNLIVIGNFEIAPGYALYSTGIVASPKDNITIQGNQITSNAVGYSGITLYLVEDESQNNNPVTFKVGGHLQGEGNTITKLDYGMEISGRTSGEGVIEGNYIGTDSNGSLGMGNFTGISINSYSTENIGRITVKDNTIAGNTFAGIDLSFTKNVIVQGNRIGTDPNGTRSIPNNYGIYLYSSSQLQIGGATSEGNLISGNSYSGISGFSLSNSSIKGNIIGLSKDENIGLGNGVIGIDLKECSEIEIGGANSERNIVAANGYEIFIIYTTSVKISRNLIGLNSANKEFGSGGWGIKLVSNNVQVIDNIIATKDYGIIVVPEQTPLIRYGSPNTFIRNVIYKNTTKSIFLQLNDGSPDGNANDGKPSPVITSFNHNASLRTITFQGTSEPNDKIEVFTSDIDAINAFKFLGEGVADASGNWSISISDFDKDPSVESFAATATSPVGNTSELGGVIKGETNSPVIGSLNENYNILAGVEFKLPVLATDPDEGDQLTFTWGSVIFNDLGAKFEQKTFGNNIEGVLTWKPSYDLVEEKNPFPVTITVTDSKGKATTKTFTIRVVDKVDALFSSNATCKSLKVDFKASVTGSGIKYIWDFGDEEPETTTAPEISHTYTSGATYQVTLTIDDGVEPNSSTAMVDVGAPKAFFTANDVCTDQFVAFENVSEGNTSYQWFFGDNATSNEQAPNHNYTSAGTYIVKLIVTKNKAECTTEYSDTVTVSGGVEAKLSVSVSDVCIGSTVNFDASASSGGESYLWDFGYRDKDGNPKTSRGIKAKHSFEKAGRYQIALTVSNGFCKDKEYFYINVTAPPVAEIEKSSAALCNDGSGIILTARLAKATSGSNYSYEWSKDGKVIGKAPTVGVDQPGEYRLLVSNSCGTANPVSVLIQPATGLTASVKIDKSITCPNATNGEAHIEGIPSDVPTTDYSILWDNGVTTLKNDHLAEGKSFVTITSKNGCKTILPVEVLYTGMKVSTEGTKAGCVAGSKGSITANVTGGTPPYTYKWDARANDQTVATAINLAVGTYSVTVSDAGGCSITKNNIEVIAPVLNVEVSNTKSCGDDPVEVVAKATLSGSEGSAFTYKWKKKNGESYTQVGTGATSKMIAGQYKIEATETSTGCTASSEFTVTRESPIELEINGEKAKCADGKVSASVAAAGGIGNYTYLWTNAAGETVSQLGEFENLPPDNYKVLVTDERGCEKSATVNLSAKPQPIIVTINQAAWDAASCYAEVMVTPEGNYSYAWIRQQTDANGVVTGYTEKTTDTLRAYGLPQGSYIVQVTNEEGCIGKSGIGIVKGRTQKRKINMQYAYKRPVNSVPTPEIQNETQVEESVQALQTTFMEEFTNCEAKVEISASQAYKMACLDPDIFTDTVSISYDLPEYHYTLYYYDRAGNLTKTVPPSGVKLLTGNQIQTVVKYRRKGISQPSPLPDHWLTTTYEYNSLDQLISQETPDAGTSQFIYDDKTRLRFSQNAEQAKNKKYSYTKYDDLGRIIEVGEQAAASFADLKDKASEKTFPATGTHLTCTQYTLPATEGGYFGQQQRYLDNRVSFSYSDVDGDEKTKVDQVITYYSYDPHGNVEWLRQEIPGLGPNYIRYDYDLITGNVLQVRYNEYRKDKFFHRYEYDADNRIRSVETSRDGIIWDKDASYQYYVHGPLKRVEIGEDKIQGTDYVYTLQGWLKGINTPELTATADPGNDGGTSGYLKDAYGMSLGYYQGDFKRNGSAFTNLHSYSAKNLYNGNISSWTMQTQEPVTGGGASLFSNKMTGQVFSYDKLNRIKSSAFNYYDAGWKTTTAYATSYEYDANGNITHLKRKAQTPGEADMDNMAYKYEIKDGRLVHNKLLGIKDSSQLDKNGLLGDIYGDITKLDNDRQYTYDAIGNLIAEKGRERVYDAAQNTSTIYKTESEITWNVYGKVETVRTRSTVENAAAVTSDKLLRFTYDASGNRIKKEVTMITPANPQNDVTTFYVRDASGNVMTVYERRNEALTQTGEYIAKFLIKEQPIYGSDRIGQVSGERVLFSKPYNVNEGLPPISFDESEFSGRVGYQNWIGPVSKLIETTVGTNWDSKLITLPNGSTVTPQLRTELLGLTGNNLAIAEDFSGNLQFYSATPTSHGGQANLCLIYDKEGHLMKNSNKVKSDAASKPIVLKHMGNNDQYYLFTIGADHNPYYHVVDMAKGGYASNTGGNMGEVVEKNNALDNSGTYKYGYHSALIEDNLTKKGLLYLTRYVPSPTPDQSGITELVVFEFNEASGSSPIPEVVARLNGYDFKGEGELQLSPDGKQLVYYNRKKSISGFAHQEVELNILTLGADKKSVTDIRVIPGQEGGTYGKASADLAGNSKFLYFNQKSIFKRGDSEENIYQYNLGSSNSQLVLGVKYGEVRRGYESSKVYIASQDDPTNITTLAQDDLGAILKGSQSIAAYTQGYGLRGSLPEQPFRYAGKSDEGYFSRFVGDKEFELKDHLGNVRAVVSDRRAASFVGINLFNTAEVRSYNDYYPFGMVMPGRNSGSYRYGYNGKELDKDGLGGGGSTYDYGFRIYNAQIAKFLSVDPLMSQYPSWSPYPFAMNRPIDGIDLDGKEFAESIFLERLIFGTNHIQKIGEGFVKRGVVSTVEGVMALKELPKVSEFIYKNFLSDNKLATVDPASAMMQQKIAAYLILAMAESIKAEYTDLFNRAANGDDEAIGALAFDVLSLATDVGEVMQAFKATKMLSKAKFLKNVDFIKSFNTKKLSWGDGVCFVAGTKVKTEKGYKNIEEIRVGDMVWAYKDTLGILSLRKVLSVSQRQWKEIYEVQVGNEKIGATSEHPFFIGGKWIKAKDLLVGDSVTLYGGSRKVIEAINIKNGDFWVYNFIVEDYHNYYVSKLDVLVHNGNPCKILTSFEDVADHVSKNSQLPTNFITKAEAEALGWKPKLGNLDQVAPGKSIGGDIFKNKEGKLPQVDGRVWYEADINYSGGFRSTDRLLYSNDGLIYKTTDHYTSFTQIQ